MVCRVERYQVVHEMRMVHRVVKVILRDQRQALREACDSTGWPEGAKVMPDEQEYHSYCFKYKTHKRILNDKLVRFGTPCT